MQGTLKVALTWDHQTFFHLTKSFTLPDTVLNCDVDVAVKFTNELDITSQIYLERYDPETQEATFVTEADTLVLGPAFDERQRKTLMHDLQQHGWTVIKNSRAPAVERDVTTTGSGLNIERWLSRLMAPTVNTCTLIGLVVNSNEAQSIVFQ